MIMFTCAIFLNLKLSLPSLIVQIGWMGTIGLINCNLDCKRCGLPTIPTSVWLQASLVWWWLMCRGHILTALATETRIRTWVLDCFQNVCPGICWTTWSQTFFQIIFQGTYNFGAASKRRIICLVVRDRPFSRRRQVPDFRSPDGAADLDGWHC